jgi:hypothetical protein
VRLQPIVEEADLVVAELRIREQPAGDAEQFAKRLPGNREIQWIEIAGGGHIGGQIAGHDDNLQRLRGWANSKHLRIFIRNTGMKTAVNHSRPVFHACAGLLAILLLSVGPRRERNWIPKG